MTSGGPWTRLTPQQNTTDTGDGGGGISASDSQKRRGTSPGVTASITPQISSRHTHRLISVPKAHSLTGEICNCS